MCMFCSPGNTSQISQQTRETVRPDDSISANNPPSVHDQQDKDDTEDDTDNDDGDDADKTEEEPTDIISNEFVKNMENKVRQKLVLLTYMRSGSTFTGDLLENHDRTFYVYEPLWRLEKKYTSGDPLTFLEKGNVTLNNGSSVFDVTSKASSYVRAMLSCDFANVDVDTLTEDMTFHAKHLDTRAYRECTGRARSNPAAKVRKCIKFLYLSCLQSQVTAVKVVRYSMEQAAQLLQSDPDVKVVHLVRDPRGMINSLVRAGFGGITWRNVEEVSKFQCGKISRDIVTSLELRARFPNRILTLRYEDIAENPAPSVQKMYEFVGLELTDAGRAFIRNKTQSSGEECMWCTERRNSSSTAYRWRSEVSFDRMQVIDRNCAEVYAMMGFRAYDTQDDVMKYLPKNDEWSLNSMR